MSLDYDPEYKACIAPILAAMAPRPAVTMDNLVTSRKVREAGFGAFYSRAPEVPSVEQTLYHATASDGYEVPVLHFAKKSLDKSKKGPALLHIHGGGMTIGSPQLQAKGTAQLAEDNDIQIFSVDYRLAPEAQQDTLTGDCYAALLWMHEHAGQFGIDRTRIAVFGESAGGGLAAGVALLARDRKLEPPLVKQVLVYPMLDDRNVVKNPVVAPFASWSTQDNITAWHAYTGIPFEQRTDDNISPYWSPARLKNFTGLPPTYIDVGTLDIFCQEGIQYAAKLQEANVPTELHVYPGIPHGFEFPAPNIKYTKMATDNRNKAIQTI